MKKFGKIILWAALIGLLVIVLAVAGLYLFFPQEKFRAMAVERIARTLDREVTIADITLSFRGGLGAYLKDIKIGNPENFEDSLFMSARALDVKLEFWPLLKKEVMIDRLILVEPEIILKKLADGSVNYKFGVIDSVAPPAVREKMTDETKLAATAIAFDNLSVERGRCIYVDDSADLEIIAAGLDMASQLTMPNQTTYDADGRVSIDSLMITSGTITLPPYDVSAEYRLLYDLTADNLSITSADLSINGLRAAIEGNVPAVSKLEKAEIDVSSEKFDLTALASLLPDEYRSPVEVYDYSGRAALAASLHYDQSTPDTITYDGHLIVIDAAFATAEFPIELTVDSARVAFDNDHADIRLIDAAFENNPLEAGVAVTGFDDPRIEGSLKSTIDLATLNSLLPPMGEPEMTGEMTIDVDFEGIISDPGQSVLTGNIDVKNAAYTAATLPEPIERADIALKLDSRDITISRFELTMPSSHFNLTGRLADAFPYFIPGYDKPLQEPFLTFEFNSQRLDIDRLFPEMAPGEGAQFAGRPPDSLPPVILPVVDGRGKGRLDTLVYMDVAFTDITSDIEIKDRMIYFNDVSGNVYTGRVTGQSTVDLNDLDHPYYKARFRAEQIEADDFLSRFTEFGGHLYGKLNLESTFNAGGLEPDSILKSLSMEGTALFHEARLVDFKLFDKVRQTLNLDHSGEEQIRDFFSHFRISDGRLALDELRFANEIGGWQLDGSVGILDGSLDFGGSVLLAEDVSGKLTSGSGLLAGLAGMLEDSETGRINVPFKLGGSYAGPKLSLDLKPDEKVKDKLKDKASDALKKLLGQ